MRLGLAIGLDRVVAVELRHTARGVRPGRVHARSLGSEPGNAAWPELGEALGELLEALDAQRATVDVALLPPLASSKVLSLPRLRRRDLRTLVERNSKRFFLVQGQRVVADAAPLRGGLSPGPRPTLGVYADADLMETIEYALSQAGLACTAIFPAATALVEAVGVLEPRARRDRLVVAIAAQEWKEGVALERGRPVSVENWTWVRAAELPAAATRMGDQAFGDDAVRRVLSLGAHGAGERWGAVEREEMLDDDAASLHEFEPAALAAFGATLLSEDAPVLLSPTCRQQRARRVTRRVSALLSAAVLTLGLVAHLHLSGVRRELEAVMAQREAHATAVTAAFELQWLAGALRERLDAIVQQQATQSNWTPTLAALAQALPDSAYLLSVTADSGGLRLEGIAPEAAAAVRALQASSQLKDVQLLAAFRQDGIDDFERFDLMVAQDVTLAPPTERPASPEGGG
jgi:Tfp pilus assembly protein PilN